MRGTGEKNIPIFVGVALCGILLAGSLSLFGNSTDEAQSKMVSMHDSALAQYDPVVAMEELKAKVEAEPLYMVECHMAAHMIGHHAYDALGEGAYEFADPLCGGGYLHGVIERALTHEGDGYLSRVIHTQCVGDRLESCLHGVGHGLRQMIGSIDEAIKLCDQISATDTDCYDGVFMDVFDTEGVKENVMSVEDALKLCKEVVGDAQQSCYFYLPRVLRNDSPETIVDLCTSPDVKEGLSACVQGSGVFFMKYLSGFDKETALGYCGNYTDTDLKKLCDHGVGAYEQYGSVTNTHWH